MAAMVETTVAAMVVMALAIAAAVLAVATMVMAIEGPRRRWKLATCVGVEWSLTLQRSHFYCTLHAGQGLGVGTHQSIQKRARV